MPLLTKPTSTLIFLLTLSLLTLLTTLHRRRSISTVQNQRPDHNHNLNHYRTTFLSTANNSTISSYLRRLTRRPHLAGTPPSLSAAIYVKSQFQALNLTTHITNFSTLLSYHKRSSVTVHLRNGTVLWNVPLSEPNVGENDGVVRPYHAYSPSGDAYGKAVFLNYGREEDYRAVGVEVEGCVGVVRRGMGMTRYEVVANAAAHGVAAVLMYTEGEYKEGVERGTVMKGVGDPLTPNWAGVEGGERLELDDPRVTVKFPRIPSLPVSQAAAERILMTLEGGRAPYEWRESLKSGGSEIKWVGAGPTMLNFTYEGEQKMATIHNVFAVIKGFEEPDRVVLLGNHRDAWTYGAVDPNSGTSVLLDIARRYALLTRLGWKPRRTIILCSWDAEEFGMIGSTEWVEQNLLNLGSKAVAYLNVDCAAQGPGFFVSATPQLDDLLVEVTKKVRDPESEKANLYERWTASNKDFPVYHTAFDSYDWMKNFGDPFFQRHVAVSGVWGLVALHLADDPVLPFNYLSYATELQGYENILYTLLEGTISLHPISAAIQDFTIAANETVEEAKKLRVEQNLDEFLVLRRRILNDRLMLAERGFLDAEGLNGRQWFKHLIYGPRGDPESKISFFPGIADAMSEGVNEEERQAAITHEIWRVARAIQRAASALRGQFT